MSELLRDINQAVARIGPCAVTIGAFDGVHLGHRALVDNLRQAGTQSGLPTVVLTFDPHPQVVLRGPDFRCLTLAEERLDRLSATGVDFVVVLPFDQELALTPARRFVEQYLVEKLKARIVVAGPDHYFGAGREGNVELLWQMGSLYGFQVHLGDPVLVDGERVSSTRIRELLVGGAPSASAALPRRSVDSSRAGGWPPAESGAPAPAALESRVRGDAICPPGSRPRHLPAGLPAGTVERAAKLLGREYSVAGRVVFGASRGARLGFPTANLQVDPLKLIPAQGVYGGRVRLAGEELGIAAINVGLAPTFGREEPVVEAYILDYDMPLYGQMLEIAFSTWVREEKRFPLKEDLVAQIQRDIAIIRSRLAV